MTLPDAANPYWKQRFIEGLPSQFATKVKEGLRQNPNEEVNWNALHYGHLQAACTQQGLALCNDLRLKKQLKQDHISAKTMGEFCKQFAFDPVPGPTLAGHASLPKRPAKPFSRGESGAFPFPKAAGQKKAGETPRERAFTAKKPWLLARSPVATNRKDKQLSLETRLESPRRKAPSTVDNHYTMPAQINDYVSRRHPLLLLIYKRKSKSVNRRYRS
ncbi:hypothetical protein H6P81_003097 [Aristolochia fimbriata]|uniref:Uncharacterized protein n=1 Tax=Aristolochia fimbriata TaxID=158543 RepID=A0AAV7FDF6_ARIFI|nr:hypothetical protein H6P81_003097 [Aristolochia fimbriata]